MTKQKKKEHLTLFSGAIEILKILKPLTDDSPYLFLAQSKQQPLKDVQNLWRRIIKKTGLHNVRIHDLRHTHASHLVSSGLSLSIVGKLLGHTQASTTQRYAHLADEPLRQAGSLFDSMVREATTKES